MTLEEINRVDCYKKKRTEKTGVKSKYTALEYAIDANHKDCVILLLQHGASLYKGADKKNNLAPIKSEHFEAVVRIIKMNECEEVWH